MEISFVTLPGITVIGKEGLCTAEKNIAAELWEQANNHFSEVADLAMKEKDGPKAGAYVGFWGAMSDETRAFLPWTENYSRGWYLAGVEVYHDAVAPEGWTRWDLPARTYLVADVQPDRYGEIFRGVIDRILPEKKLKLTGAVCDYTEPATGQNKLFFPVSETD